MSLKDAIQKRVSRRIYTEDLLPEKLLNNIDEIIAKYQASTDIRIEHIRDASDTFTSIELDYGFFKNVDHVIAFYGKKEDKYAREKTGYFGEFILLELVDMGIGTCWIVGTYNPESNIFKLDQEEELIGIISFGYSPERLTEKEDEKRRMRRSEDKAIEEFYTSEKPIDNWFINGVSSVRRGPSTRNSQPVKFHSGEQIVIYVDPYENYNCIDLGIGKAHFELTCDGKFPIGNYATFVRNK